MDSFLDFTYLLLKNDGVGASPPHESFHTSSSEPADILVDAERAGGTLAGSFCVIS